MSVVDSRIDLAANIRRVEAAIALAARRAGRDPAEIALIAVTKTVPPELVAAAAGLGLRRFGENRVQEAAGKIPRARALLNAEHPAEWHLIGHLQTNKVRAAIGCFDTIESVDSVRLAERISAEAGRLGRVVPVMLEVNVGREASKHGFMPEELAEAASSIAELPHLAMDGLMTVAPLTDDGEAVRRVFRQLRLWRDRLRTGIPRHGWQHLSMGMSNDFEVAIEEGATIVRIGRAIFGERPAVR